MFTSTFRIHNVSTFVFVYFSSSSHWIISHIDCLIKIGIPLYIRKRTITYPLLYRLHNFNPKHLYLFRENCMNEKTRGTFYRMFFFFHSHFLWTPQGEKRISFSMSNYTNTTINRVLSTMRCDWFHSNENWTLLNMRNMRCTTFNLGRTVATALKNGSYAEWLQENVILLCVTVLKDKEVKRCGEFVCRFSMEYQPT